MVSGRPPGDAADAPSRPRRSRPPNEEGLRSLGSMVDGGAGPARVPNEEGLRTLGDKVDRQGASPARPPARHAAGAPGARSSSPLVALVVLALLVVGGAYGYARYRYDQIPKVHIAAEVAAVSGQPFNILVIGSDSRGGLPAATFGSTTTVPGQRSDVDMIWHVDPATKQITILSIPRDTLVSWSVPTSQPSASSTGSTRRTTAGPNLLVQTIEANFGIPINHVIQVDFAGFEGAVNALGGVYLDFTYPAKRRLLGPGHHHPGLPAARRQAGAGGGPQPPLPVLRHRGLADRRDR